MGFLLRGANVVAVTCPHHGCCHIGIVAITTSVVIAKIENNNNENKNQTLLMPPVGKAIVACLTIILKFQSLFSYSFLPVNRIFLTLGGST
jgi:hypothetical protein